jgi:hypothetical protein
MAFIQNKYCHACEGNKIHTNGLCNDCRERSRREALALWGAKTTDEKLLDMHKRLLKIEAGQQRY